MKLNRKRIPRSAKITARLATPQKGRKKIDNAPTPKLFSPSTRQNVSPQPQIKSTIESEQTKAKQKKGKKRNFENETVAVEVTPEDQKPVIPEILYDEYEEDTSPLRVAGPAAIRRQSPSPSPPILEESIPEEPDVKRKKRKRKKKGMKEQEASGAAALSAEAEKNRNLLIQKMQEEIRLEKHYAEEQAQEDEAKSELRRDQLKNTWNKIDDNERAFLDYVVQTQEEKNWTQYLSCDGLPSASSVPDMNKFLFLWKNEENEADMETVTKRCQTVTSLLQRLDDIIDFLPVQQKLYMESCKEVRKNFRDMLQSWLDRASYSLLRQIEKKMKRVDLKNARYIKEAQEIICCMWALIKLPVSMKEINERDKKNIEILFEELNLTVKMPIDENCYCMAIRALWVEHDHYSDQGKSFAMPELPEEYQTTLDLLSYCQEEYETKRRIRESQAEGRKLRLEEKNAELERLLNPPQLMTAKSEKKGKGAKKTPPLAAKAKKTEPEVEPKRLSYLPTPEEILLTREEDIRKEVRKLLFTRCEKTEINLRKYAILGGIYHIDLLEQPPQPKDMRQNISLTILQLPEGLKFVRFCKPYKAPPPCPESERSPEVVEKELKALEAAMEALALITLKLPDRVLWFEPPLVAHWIPGLNIWSTQNVHDIKYNEEKQIITFRAGSLGPHGLAAYRFINLPYQSWELKPLPKKKLEDSMGIVLSITAAIVQVEFIVQEDLVCLHSLIGGTSTTLQKLLDEYMDLLTLIRKMRAGGCDLFPERDAYSYVKGLPVKHTVTEHHLQVCMGLLAPAYSFAWSRWNATVTPRQIVMQLKEMRGCIAKEKSNMTLLVTPLQTSVVQCTEVSPEFSDQPIEGSENQFFADVYNLALYNAGIRSKMMIKSVSFKLAKTVTDLLRATNVISMSS